MNEQDTNNLIRFYRKFACACDQIKARGLEIGWKNNTNALYVSQGNKKVYYINSKIKEIHPLFILLEGRVQMLYNHLWSDAEIHFNLKQKTLSSGLYVGFSLDALFVKQTDDVFSSRGLHEQALESFKIARYLLNKIYGIKLTNGKSILE